MSQDQAEFWQDGAKSDQVVRHAPDSDGYHYPDSAQLGQMRSSKVGRFAVIPAATKDGASRGFDPSRAGPVHIDPDAPDGGVIFDPSTVRAGDISRAVASSQYAHQPYYQLGTPAAQFKAAGHSARQPEPQSVPNPHMPGTYVTPHANASPTYLNTSQRTPEEYALTPVPPMPEAPQQPALQPGPAQYQPQPQQTHSAPVQYAQPQYAPPPQYYSPPPQYLPPDTTMQAMMSALAGLQQQVASLAARPALPPTTGMSPIPLPNRNPLATVPGGPPMARQRPDEEYDGTSRPIRKRVERKDEEEQPQTLREYTDSQNPEDRDAIITGFETLEMKFLNGPLPNKAKRKATFEIPGAGKQTAWYHDIIVSKACIALVYDTRFEGGQQYEPPDAVESKILLHLPNHPKPYVVSAAGLTYMCGVLSHTVLVRNDDAAPDYEADR